MEPTAPCDHPVFTTAIFRGAEPGWERCERELTEENVPIPLSHRAAWGRAFAGTGELWHVVAQDPSGVCRAGIGVAVARSRALPGHLLLRVTRCGQGARNGALEAALAALAHLGRQNSRILRVSVELFSPNPAVREKAGETLAQLGFRRQMDPRGYADTIAVDLKPDQDAIFAGLHKKTRRDIRATAKHAIEVRPITDPAFAHRMEDMRRVTYARTGGAFVGQDWEPVIEFCRQYPELARLVGQFRTDLAGPDSLLAYAWSLHHGDHAQYHTAASVRDESIKVPLAYALIWDLICWAKRTGASWFDMGGVTQGSLGDESDPLGGISDFKRYFSKTVISVGEEWEYEPHPLRARVARAIGTVAGWFSRARGG